MPRFPQTISLALLGTIRVDFIDPCRRGTGSENGTRLEFLRLSPCNKVSYLSLQSIEWQEGVPPEILASLPESEVKRQTYDTGRW